MEKVFLGVLSGQAEPGLIRVVRATLDFIYYAHFQSHTTQSLRNLDAAWVSFHQKKHYFVDKGIRTHFSIPKIHSMQHYIAAIISTGSADGFSSEHPERLHIDFAKSAYRATNKREYVKQMTTWLRRQDACYRFSSYLNWAALEVTDNTEDDPGDDDPEDSDDEDDAPYTLPISTLIDEFGAVNFVEHLSDYLRSSPAASTRIPTLRTTLRLPVYKQFTIHIPPVSQVTQDITKDVVHTRRAVAQKGTTAASPSRFDTILAQEEGRGMEKEHALEGLAVAQIRTIFRLPEDFGAFTEPLAYVEWYTPLTSQMHDIGMYKISPSTRRNQRRASIIPLSHVERTVHLIPKFGRTADRSWTSDNILDKCKSFFVNPYFRHIDFVLFRYLAN